MEQMEIYVVEGRAGQWADSYQWNVLAFKKKENAEKFIENIEKFIPRYHCNDKLHRACKFELVKMGLMYGWRDDYEDIPYFTINQTYLED